MMEEMMGVEGDVMEFEVHREVTEKGVSFSEDALDVFFDSIAAFIGTRVMRQWNDTGIAPQKMKVRVSVEVK